MGPRDEEPKYVWKLTKKRKVKRCMYQSKEKVNKPFGRKMNEDLTGNGKLF